jgi:hypothetical protein
MVRFVVRLVVQASLSFVQGRLRDVGGTSFTRVWAGRKDKFLTNKMIALASAL